MKHATLLRALFVSMICGLTLMNSISVADENERFLYDFDSEESAKSWQTVNDGVMGGKSEGRFKLEDQHLMFYGNLSLENNGGVASVRSKGAKLGLQQGDSITMRVRGDGREYSLNLYTPRRLTAFSYRAMFETKKDEWVQVSIPMKDFVATSFGRVVPNMKLDPTKVNGLGILLGDKMAGQFQLEIDWIKVGKKTDKP